MTIGLDEIAVSALFSHRTSVTTSVNSVVMVFHRSRVVTISVAATLLLAAVALYRYGRPGDTYNQLLPSDMSRFVENAINRLHPDGMEPNSPAAMYKRLVVFTAFSSNHFEEALDMIGSVQKYLPHTKIIIYDIGLSAEERGEVAKYCNVELRRFDFSRYPPHVKKIRNYAWRPFMSRASSK